MPDDENFAYLSTQAIADFLATENEPLLDGIAYPSVQTAGNGLNIVLFHKAARVETMDLPENTKITASVGEFNEDGWVINYQVTEEILPQIPPKTINPFENSSFSGDTYHLYNDKNRDATLRIDLKSVKINIIKKVQFEADEHSVQRLRLQNSDNPF